MKISITIISLLILISTCGISQDKLQRDLIKTSKGELTITFVGHGSLIFQFNDQTIYVDPSSSSGHSFEGFPSADLVLITHQHGDHLDLKTLDLISTDKTKFLSNPKSFERLMKGKMIKNGESTTIAGFHIQAVPAYNIKSLGESGEPFHPKGEGNGYVFNFGDKKVYVAGDTENIPELAKLKNIDIAFLPMNVPYTMTPEMARDAALLFKPKLLYPYHYRGTDPQLLINLLKDYPEIEIKIR